MPARDIAALTAPLAIPALHVLKTAKPSLSHFGGNPSLPENLTWPEHDGRKLDFLARISLAEVQKNLSVDWLPQTGALLFFYDMENQPWGFYPEHRGGFAVLFAPDRPEPVSPNPAKQVDPATAVPYANIELRPITVLPPYGHDLIAPLDLDDDEIDLFCELTDKPFLDAPKHQIAGYPYPIQNDTMEQECQGIYNRLAMKDKDPDTANPIAGAQGWRLLFQHIFNRSAVKSKAPETKQPMPGAQDWRLLFQVDSDDDLGLMWGDVGKIYFWVKQDEARQGNFANAWVILQCY